MHSLAEPATPLDRRVNAYREDLAEARLRGQVRAAAYVEGAPGRIVAARAPILAAPNDDATRISEAVFGEALTCLENRDGWAWVKMAHDGYVGYVRSTALGEQATTASHRIIAPRALLFSEPNLKAPIRGWLPLAAVTGIQDESGDYRQVANGFWTHGHWIASADSPLADPVATANLFLGAPYGWGGRTIVGLDCSGLVQIALSMAGIDCPRDTDQQEAALGRKLEADEPARRGDLVFFPGHVGFMVDGDNLLHANASNMAVTIDPLERVEAIVRKADSQGRGITSRRRLAG